ncbi:3-deoxy-D-manno-octulosonic acid transferase [Flavobacterium sp. W21_SRS_FM6]|uniref:3-deoxy-D-manno-octulosonic acid transferase n=1 Tax=Flavobacterium sp. W21_SRS_FM6 TaxID=3240268 RepID=UPI003F8E015A
MPRLTELSVKGELARYLYSLLWLLLLPILLINWLFNFTKFNSVVAKEYLSRFGYSNKSIVKGGIWLHCASVGEVVAMQQLVERLLITQPCGAITISTNTMTGRERVQQLFADKVVHLYLPYDFSWCIYPLLKKIQPRKLLITEMELWPNLCHCSWRKKVPTYLVNGRMSEKSAASYQKLAWLSQPLLNKLSGICAQGTRDVDNYLALGANNTTLVLTNNVKFDLVISENDYAEAAKMSEKFHLKNRTIIVAGSTHDSEELVAIEAYRQLAQQFPNLLLILVPRHPQRFSEVNDILLQQKLIFTRMSEPEYKENLEVLLVDKMGVLRALYSLANIAFVGGSIALRGGHNALEPAAFGVPILMGKSTYNNPQICETLHQAGALAFIENSDDFSQQCVRWLEDETLRQQATDAGLRVIKQNRGAIERTLAVLNLL